MQIIHVLDHHTIDQIAAGEVVERPASIVKELAENAMDAGANAVTVEIRGGGIEFIRVTDNGCGIYKEDIPNAFLRHATSKIHDITDLDHLSSMGFRGEALASIASVSKVTLITKRSEELLGHKTEVNGGEAGEIEEIGAPDGTTVTSSHLFYNIPARRKFLKTPVSEGNAVEELVEHLSLARPDISYKFIVNGKTKFMTSGSGDLRDVIYRIYGREMSKNVVPVSFEKDGIRIDGYLGEPSLNRPNRNFENYFLNRRYIRSEVIAKSIEEGYRGYTMQHKFPFCVLHITMDGTQVDVNVHPAKMDVRFHDRQVMFDCMNEAVSETLHAAEMIPEAVLEKTAEKKLPESAPEPFEKARLVEKTGHLSGAEKTEEELNGDRVSAESEIETTVTKENRDIFEVDFSDEDNAPLVTEYKRTSSTTVADKTFAEIAGGKEEIIKTEAEEDSDKAGYDLKEDRNIEKEGYYPKAEQMSILPKGRVISANARKQYRLIGSIFNTYWMFSYQNDLYFVDQHAAHEKVNYEKLVAQYAAHEVYTQQCDPPIIVSLSLQESEVLESYIDHLTEMGFSIEHFGGSEYAISSVPYELYRKNPKQLFMEILNELSVKGMTDTPKIIDHVLATIACKSAVKGGDVISAQEMETILDELMTLKNPYHCPHGRPTIFSMSRTELERKFKRIVN